MPLLKKSIFLEITNIQKQERIISIQIFAIIKKSADYQSILVIVDYMIVKKTIQTSRDADFHVICNQT